MVQTFFLFYENTVFFWTYYTLRYWISYKYSCLSKIREKLCKFDAHNFPVRVKHSTRAFSQPLTAGSGDLIQSTKVERWLFCFPNLCLSSWVTHLSLITNSKVVHNLQVATKWALPELTWNSTWGRRWWRRALDLVTKPLPWVACHRLFMRGFWLRSSLHCDPREGETNQPHERKKHLVPRVISLSRLHDIVGEAVASQGFCK